MKEELTKIQYCTGRFPLSAKIYSQKFWSESFWWWMERSIDENGLKIEEPTRVKALAKKEEN